MKAFIDKYLDFTISKKLTVFIIATVFFSMAKLSSTEWLIVTSSYLSIQGAKDIWIAYLTNK